MREKDSFHLKPVIKVFGTDGVSEICSVLTDILFYDCQQTIKLMLSHTNEWNIFSTKTGNWERIRRFSVCFSAQRAAITPHQRRRSKQHQHLPFQCNQATLQEFRIRALVLTWLKMCVTLLILSSTQVSTSLSHCIIRQAGHVTITCQLSCFDRIAFT